VHLHRHIGVIVVLFHTRIRGVLCKPCLDVVFSETFFITLFAGWWGLVSVFATAFFVPFDLASYVLTRASYGSAETPSSAGTRTMLSVVAGILPLVGLFCGGPYLLLAGLGPLFEGSDGDQTTGSTVAVTHPCRGTGSPTAPAYDAAQSIRALAYVQRDEDRWMRDTDYLPEAWVDSPDIETPVAVCIDAEQRDIVEACADVDANHIAYPRAVRVLEARTARELTRVTAVGADRPGPCPAAPGGHTLTSSGAHVQPADVRVALAQLEDH
jgi:hypothetical protein